jgi:hypothetical protein
MPPLPVIPNAVKVSYTWSLSGQASAVITFGITTSLSDLAAVASAIDSHVTAGMWGPITASATAIEIKLFKYDGVTPTFTQPVTGAKYQGQDAGLEAEVAPAALISFRTATRGQWARGRCYLPFISEGAAGNGSLLDTVRVSTQTAWDSFRNGMSGGGTPMAVISLANQPNLNPPHTPTARLVISSTVEAHLATQRRRQDRIRRS